MTSIGTILQLLFSAILTLIPAIILKQKQMNITIGLCFLSLMATSKVGGLIFALPVTFLLLLFFLWLRFVSKAHYTLFILTLVIVVLWLLSQIIHLPIRVYLGQPAVKIAANIAGLLFAIACTSGCVEFFFLHKRRKRQEPEQHIVVG